MTARELLKLMEDGAILTSHWKRRRSTLQKPKYLYTLVLPGGEIINVQRSSVDALVKTGAIHSTPMFGDDRKYTIGNAPPIFSRIIPNDN